MAHQLVRQAAGNALQEQRIIGVLENGAMTLLLDVRDVGTCFAARRISLAHIAEPSRKLGEPLTIGVLAHPLHWQMRRLEELRTGNEGDLRLEIDLRR